MDSFAGVSSAVRYDLDQLGKCGVWTDMVDDLINCWSGLWNC
jgi:hypothetical protein